MMKLKMIKITIKVASVGVFFSTRLTFNFNMTKIWLSGYKATFFEQ